MSKEWEYVVHLSGNPKDQKLFDFTKRQANEIKCNFFIHPKGKNKKAEMYIGKL